MRRWRKILAAVGFHVKVSDSLSSSRVSDVPDLSLPRREPLPDTVRSLTINLEDQSEQVDSELDRDSVLLPCVSCEVGRGAGPPFSAASSQLVLFHDEVLYDTYCIFFRRSSSPRRESLGDRTLGTCNVMT